MVYHNCGIFENVLEEMIFMYGQMYGQIDFFINNFSAL